MYTVLLPRITQALPVAPAHLMLLLWQHKLAVSIHKVDWIMCYRGSRFEQSAYIARGIVVL